MLDINLLRNNIKLVAENALKKKINIDIDKFNQLETDRKSLQTQLEQIQALRNSSSKQIGVLKCQGQDTHELLSKIANLGNELKAIQEKFTKVQNEINTFVEKIPNLLHESVPYGMDETNNIEVRRVGHCHKFDFIVKDHVSLGYNLNKQMDFELATKISGSRFIVLKAQIAKLHRVLSQFMLDIHTREHGYEEVYVPYIVNKSAAFGSGQLPKFEEDFFKTSRNNEELYLISTSEIPITNFVADKIVKEATLPLKYTAHTPCFRSEAGSYGQDTRGMIRMHQFDKVEMVQIVKQENSNTALEEMTIHAEKILQKLELPYRVMLLCSGDTGFSASKTYDLEVWLPSQNTYREISSCSNMTDFQARRIQARFKNSIGKNELLHTLNGSGLAVGRTLVAILENYQNADGSITIPHVLRERMGQDVIN